MKISRQYFTYHLPLKLISCHFQHYEKKIMLLLFENAFPCSFSYIFLNHFILDVYKEMDLPYILIQQDISLCFQHRNLIWLRILWMYSVNLSKFNIENPMLTHKWKHNVMICLKKHVKIFWKSKLNNMILLSTLLHQHLI